MDAHDSPSSPAAATPGALLAQVFGAALSTRVGVRNPTGCVSLAVVGLGAWTFAASAPSDGRPGWDEAADVQILCEEAVLESLLTGAAVTPGHLLLVSGDPSVVDGIGSLFGGSGSPLAVRLGGRSA